MGTLLAILALSLLGKYAFAQDYFGVRCGSFQNSTYGLNGEVYLVNQTHLQINKFSINVPSDDLQLEFTFTDGKTVRYAEAVYEYLSSPSGDYAKPAPKELRRYSNARLIVALPDGSTNDQWSYVGPSSKNQWFYLAAARCGKKAPEAITTSSQLRGSFYGVSSGPIRVMDAKTLLLPSFTFEGNKPPDGWIFVGSGNVGRNTGKKAFIEGRDTKSLHCPIRDFINRQDLSVKLPDDMTVYDISYVSVYCYAVGVDFGHVPIRLNRATDIVPPLIPPVRDSPPPAEAFGWRRPSFLADSVSSLDFFLGPPGGNKAKAFRGACDNLDAVWYVNGYMTPEIWVQRGKTYNFKINGGQEHPLYITSEETGGWVLKPPSEQQAIRNYAGDNGDKSGELCVWRPTRSVDPDSFDSFDDFKRILSSQCPRGPNPAILSWQPDANTPSVVYYASYDSYNMGGPIRVCNQIGGSPTDPQCL